MDLAILDWREPVYERKILGFAATLGDGLK